MPKMKLLTAGFLILGVFVFMGFSESASQSKFIRDTSSNFKSEALVDSFTDGKAIVSDVTGTAKILRADTDEWVLIAENDTLQEGDQIRTGNDGTVDIIYDDSSLNITHIKENTIAKFISLEPTRIYLADGSVFSSLEALPKGQEYEVATDTSVNAIRGTKFLRTFEAEEQEDSTIVADGAVQSFSVLEDGTESEESVFIQKGNALTVTPALLRATSISKLQPVLTSLETQEQMDEVAKTVEKRLEDASGGPEALKRHRDRVLVTMEKPEFQKAFKEKHEVVLQKRREALMEKGGPDVKRPVEYSEERIGMIDPERKPENPITRVDKKPGFETKTQQKSNNGAARPPKTSQKSPAR